MKKYNIKPWWKKERRQNDRVYGMHRTIEKANVSWNFLQTDYSGIFRRKNWTNIQKVWKNQLR